ncbi:hypothetical protein C8J56DRAFT_251200 [Mycena floridula]|nr:hypothetical protein C8J56DRAFT_251200 [Mycena floridula]
MQAANSTAVHHAQEDWEHRQLPQTHYLKNFPSEMNKRSPDSASSSSSLSPPAPGFLISPLPEFTSHALPSMQNSFSPLPDVDLAEQRTQFQSFAVNASSSNDVFVDSPEDSPSMASPSLLTMTAPRSAMRNGRSHSFSASRQSSNPPTCPSSPSVRPMASTSLQTVPTATFSAGNAPRETERLRNRLRDLLDPAPTVSSSLPTLSSSSSFPPRGRDSRHTPETSRPPSRPPSRAEGSLSNSMPVQIDHSKRAPADGPGPGPSSLSSSYNGNQSRMMSHASAAAQQAMERERASKEERKNSRERERDHRSREPENSSRLAAPPHSAPLSSSAPKSSQTERPPLSRTSTQSTMATSSSHRSEMDRVSRSGPLPIPPPNERERPSRQYTDSAPVQREPVPTSSYPSSNNNALRKSALAPNPVISRDSAKRPHHQTPASSIGSSKGRMIASTIVPQGVYT